MDLEWTSPVYRCVLGLEEFGRARAGRGPQPSIRRLWPEGILCDVRVLQNGDAGAIAKKERSHESPKDKVKS